MLERLTIIMALSRDMSGKFSYGHNCILIVHSNAIQCSLLTNTDSVLFRVIPMDFRYCEIVSCFYFFIS